MLKEIGEIKEEEKSNFVQVKRDLLEKEILEKQIKIYSPCICGSGKKMKFCCYRKKV